MMGCELTGSEKIAGEMWNKWEKAFPDLFMDVSNCFGNVEHLRVPKTTDNTHWEGKQNLWLSSSFFFSSLAFLAKILYDTCTSLNLLSHWEVVKSSSEVLVLILWTSLLMENTQLMAAGSLEQKRYGRTFPLYVVSVGPVVTGGGKSEF